jgi:hypothetical protein
MASAFSLALRVQKRLKMIDDKGVEQFEQPNDLDTSYLALVDPKRQQQDEQKEDSKVGGGLVVWCITDGTPWAQQIGSRGRGSLHAYEAVCVQVCMHARQ